MTTADLVTFTETILNEKSHLRSVQVREVRVSLLVNIQGFAHCQLFLKNTATKSAMQHLQNLSFRISAVLGFTPSLQGTSSFTLPQK